MSSTHCLWPPLLPLSFSLSLIAAFSSRSLSQHTGNIYEHRGCCGDKNLRETWRHFWSIYWNNTSSMKICILFWKQISQHFTAQPYSAYGFHSDKSINQSCQVSKLSAVPEKMSDSLWFKKSFAMVFHKTIDSVSYGGALKWQWALVAGIKAQKKWLKFVNI